MSIFMGNYFVYAQPLADPVRLMVKKDVVEDARAILQDGHLAFRGLSNVINPKELED